MTDDELSSVLASGTISNLRRSEYLFEQGDHAVNLFLVLDGWAQITRDERDGSNMLIATFHKGDSLAEAAAFLGKLYPASAQAIDRSARAVGQWCDVDGCHAKQPHHARAVTGVRVSQATRSGG